MLAIGTQAPDFRLRDQNGAERSLAAEKGRIVLVYFYPKDDTPGCTAEACGIRDMYADFARAGVTVFGISHDTPESHRTFIDKYQLPFTLLSDPKREAVRAYGALGGVLTRRISYLIGTDGKILKAYPKVDPVAHAGEILKDIYALEAK